MDLRLLGSWRGWRVGSALGRRFAQSPEHKSATDACCPSLSPVPLRCLSCTKVSHLNPRVHIGGPPTSLARKERDLGVPVNQPVRESANRGAAARVQRSLLPRLSGPAAHFVVARNNSCKMGDTAACSSIPAQMSALRLCRARNPCLPPPEHLDRYWPVSKYGLIRMYQLYAFAANNQRLSWQLSPQNDANSMQARTRWDADLGLHCVDSGI